MITLKIFKENNEEFSFEKLKSIKSFIGRKRYCDEHLTYITSGSSRLVYKLNSERVLKLAKNIKGISQNEAEFLFYDEPYIPQYIFAKIYSVDEENFIYLESQYAEKCKKSDFKRIIGYTFDEYRNALLYYYTEINGRTSMNSPKIDKDVYADMWENEFMYDIFDFIANFNVPIYDLLRLNSYGVIDNNILIVDYGLSDESIKHYK